ncbi:MAG: hypothetical protein MUE73_19165 [Planctomycetes bacterium]|jgi:hypothetical protein|nr:hypothetical protein [Planctomycetota bacterium]
MRAGGRNRQRLTVVLAFLLLVGLGPPGVAQDAEEEPEAPKPAPSIAPHVPLDVGANRPRPAASYRRVEALIADLAKLDDWRDGISLSSGGGVGFDPHGTDQEVPEGHPGHEAFTALVALGAEAISALLVHLDDERETELTVGHSGWWGGMWCQTEVDANAAMPAELAAIRAAFPGGWPDDPACGEARWERMQLPVFRHAVTIGDCCFAILGQIVNRVYEAVRYQPTSCFVVNSPTRDPRIARAVRLQWEGRDPRVELARRLADDLFTAPAGDDRSEMGDRQAGAAERLLTWFPEASEGWIVAMVDAVDGPGVAGTEPACQPAYEILRRLGWCDRPAIRAACLRLALRTDSPYTLHRVLDAIDPAADEALHARLVGFLAGTTGAFGESGWVGCFLRAIRDRWPERYEAALVAQLKRTLSDVQVVAEQVYRDGTLLPVAAWRPMLVSDVKAVPWTSGGKHPLERLRLCDVAAREIARQRPDLPFDESADETTRDARIQAMRTVLDAEGRR